MRVWLIFAILLLSLSQVSAITYDNYFVEAEIEENVLFTIDATGTFDNEILTFQLPPSSDNIIVLVDENEETCTIKEEVGFTTVTCNKLDGLHSITLTYESSYPLVPLAGDTFFQMDQSIESNFFIFTLKLPVGAIISDERFVTPEPTRLYSDGQRIIVSWEEVNLDDVFKVSLLLQNLEKKENALIYVVLFFVGFVLVIALLYRKKQTITRKGEISISQMLLENEKKIITALQEAKDNQLWQKELQIKTELSKVKLSRLIKSMQKRGLVKKEPYGASNIIKLTNNTE